MTYLRVGILGHGAVAFFHSFEGLGDHLLGKAAHLHDLDFDVRQFLLVGTNKVVSSLHQIDLQQKDVCSHWKS